MLPEPIITTILGVNESISLGRIILFKALDLSLKGFDFLIGNINETGIAIGPLTSDINLDADLLSGDHNIIVGVIPIFKCVISSTDLLLKVLVGSL